MKGSSTENHKSLIPFPGEMKDDPEGRLLSVERSKIAEAISKGDGRGIKIAVIDSGIETSHPGLKGLELADDFAITLRGSQLKIENGEGRDVFGHGTAIAGIIRKIAPKAEIGSFRVLGLGSGGTQAPVIREAVRLALDRGYHVLNCSFGCVAKRELLSSFKNWIDDAFLKSCHVVAAGSNEDSGIVEWPAHFPTVLSVSHVETSDRESIYFRNGQMVQFGANGAENEALWAFGSRKQVMGSSFASPKIAAQLARLLSVYPETPTLLAKEAMANFANSWPQFETPVIAPVGDEKIQLHA